MIKAAAPRPSGFLKLEGKEGGGERESEKINVYLGEMQVKSMQGFFALILYIRIYIKGTLCCCL